MYQEIPCRTKPGRDREKVRAVEIVCSPLARSSCGSRIDERKNTCKHAKEGQKPHKSMRTAGLKDISTSPQEGEKWRSN